VPKKLDVPKIISYQTCSLYRTAIQACTASHPVRKSASIYIYIYIWLAMHILRAVRYAIHTMESSCQSTISLTDPIHVVLSRAPRTRLSHYNITTRVAYTLSNTQNAEAALFTASSTPPSPPIHFFPPHPIHHRVRLPHPSAASFLRSSTALESQIADEGREPGGRRRCRTAGWQHQSAGTGASTSAAAQPKMDSKPEQPSRAAAVSPCRIPDLTVKIPPVVRMEAV
jgi:hypothetical protein